MYYALIKKNIVDSVIIADDYFIDNIKNQYDYIIKVEENDRPSPGDSFYPETQVFISNNNAVHHLDSDLKSEGVEKTFEPVKLSKYTMTHENGMVRIGCKLYSPKGLLEAADKVLNKDESHTFCFTTNDAGPSHGKFQITWDDTRLIYATLKRLKL